MKDLAIALKDRPGALAEADAGVNIEVLYSDHDNQLEREVKESQKREPQVRGTRKSRS